MLSLTIAGSLTDAAWAREEHMASTATARTCIFNGREATKEEAMAGKKREVPKKRSEIKEKRGEEKRGEEIGEWGSLGEGWGGHGYKMMRNKEKEIQSKL